MKVLKYTIPYSLVKSFASTSPGASAQKAEPVNQFHPATPTEEALEVHSFCQQRSLRSSRI
jgi:hypothetical protein